MTITAIPTTAIPPADPYIEQLDGLVKELEQHANSNRTNVEQSLYTEIVPRLIAIVQTIRSCFTAEELYPPPEEIDRPPGAWIEIRYNTATMMEALLHRLAQQQPKDEQISTSLFCLLQDLYGVDPQMIEEQFKIMKEKAHDQKKS